MRTLTLFLGLMLAAAVLPGMATAAELTLKSGWVRLVPPVSDNSAAYLKLENPGRQPVRIVGVSSDVAAMAMLHGMSMQDGRMKMFALKSLEVPAHGGVSLAPGGSHVMLMGLKQPLARGASVRLTLRYADGTTQNFDLKVVDARGGGMGAMHRARP